MFRSRRPWAGTLSPPTSSAAFRFKTYPYFLARGESYAIVLTGSVPTSPSLLTYFNFTNPSSSFNTPEVTAALGLVQAGLDPLISSVYDVVQNPSHTFPLGTAITVGTAELAKSDRLIAGMLAAQGAAGYNDQPEPDCQSPAAASAANDAYTNAVLNGDPNANYYRQAFWGCAVSQAFTVGFSVTGAALGIATGVGALLFGAEALTVGTAAVAGYMLYATVVSGGSLISIGGAMGQPNAYGQALVQSGVKLIDDYLTDAAKSLVISKTFGETIGTLYDIAVNGKEAYHALECAPP